MSMSWPRSVPKRALEASGTAAYARGAQVLKERMPTPPSLVGRSIRVSSKVAAGAGNVAALIPRTEVARVSQSFAEVLQVI